MAVNGKDKQLSSLSKKALQMANGQKRAWFAVGVGKDFLFYIDKKLTDPMKFKEPLKIHKLLTSLNMDSASKVDKNSLLIAGTILEVGEQYEMTVKVKVNGGGKSTLKGLVKDATFKKIVGKVELVKEHGGGVDAADKARDAEIAAELKDKGVSGVKVSKDASGAETVEVPEKLRKALKLYKWWDKEGRAELARLRDGKIATSSDEDILQTIQRRLTRFQKESMYSLFADGKIWRSDGALKKLRPDDYDLTDSDLKKYLEETKKLLDTLQSKKSSDDFDKEVSEMVDAVEEDAEEYSELEKIAKRLKLNEDQYLDFMDAGKGNLALVKDLVSKFSNDDVKKLLKYVGGGNWDRLFFQLMCM